jgi:hypothetical protein
MALKLTPTQETALRTFPASGRASKWHARLSTMERLRKLGLAERYTRYVIRAEYADAKGVSVQYDSPADDAYADHEYWLTRMGLNERDRLRAK